MKGAFREGLQNGLISDVRRVVACAVATRRTIGGPAWPQASSLDRGRRLEPTLQGGDLPRTFASRGSDGRSARARNVSASRAQGGLLERSRPRARPPVAEQAARL